LNFHVGGPDGRAGGGFAATSKAASPADRG
jgi:hypothetical protein